MSNLNSPMGFLYSWVMTLFSHNFKNMDIPLRIFDFVLCNYINQKVGIEIYICILFIKLIYKNIKVKKKLILNLYKFDLNKFGLDDINYLLKVSLELYEKYN